jgi:MFS family permease
MLLELCCSVCGRVWHEEGLSYESMPSRSWQVGFGGWLPEYVHQRGLMGEAESAYVGSGFWAGLTLGMLASIALANKVPCRTLLASATLAAALPAGAIVVFPESKLVAWVASCLFGVCLGPIYPSVMAFFTAEVGCRVRRRPTLLDMTSSLAPLSCTQPGFVGSLVLLVCCVDLASRHSVVCATCALFCERH